MTFTRLGGSPRIAVGRESMTTDAIDATIPEAVGATEAPGF
jgi:hypothetical protein